MIDSIFILSNHGDVLIEKHYRTITKRAVADTFWTEVCKCARREDVSPVLHVGKYYFVNLFRGDIFIVAVMTTEGPPLFVIEFLQRMVTIFEQYFGSVQERQITAHFSYVYQILEEMLDSGYPMLSEPNALTALIAPPSIGSKVASLVTGKSAISDKISSATTSVIPWRKADVKYAQNEIFFDIVEQVDCIVDATGNVIANDVIGRIHAKSHLSGMPDVTVVFSDPRIVSDASLHPCVRVSRFERERIASFVPPDGDFLLFEYRYTPAVFTVPLYCRPDVTYREGGARVSFTVGQKPMAMRTGSTKAGSRPGDKELVTEDIVLIVNFPKAYVSVDVAPNTGTIVHDPKTNQVRWTIHKMPKDKIPRLEGSVRTDPASGRSRAEEDISATLQFVVPSTTVSGIGIKDVAIGHETYKFYKGVRTTLRAGRFQIRC